MQRVATIFLQDNLLWEQKVSLYLKQAKIEKQQGDEESVQIRQEQPRPVGLHPWVRSVQRMQQKPCAIREGR